MGTRSLTIMQDSWDHKEIAVMYRQFDGYPSGLGVELAEFLSGFRIVNGITDKIGKVANGGSCLAAQIVAHFKDEVGNVYLEPAGTRNCGEEYVYIVTPEVDKGVTLTVQEVRIKDTSLPIDLWESEYIELWRGNPEDYDPAKIAEQD